MARACSMVGAGGGAHAAVCSRRMAARSLGDGSGK